MCGGNSPGFIIWSNGKNTNQSILNLSAGTYTLNVTDSVIAQQLLPRSLPNPQRFHTLLDSIDDGCDHQSGIVSVLHQAGTPGYFLFMEYRRSKFFNCKSGCHIYGNC
jgi:hypothetical protein